MSAVTFHYYTLPYNDWKHKGAAVGFDENEWISTLAHTSTTDHYISHNISVWSARDTDNEIGFTVDDGAPGMIHGRVGNPVFLYQQNTLRDAFVAALNVNISHHHADRLHMANIAQMMNVL